MLQEITRDMYLVRKSPSPTSSKRLTNYITAEMSQTVSQRFLLSAPDFAETPCAIDWRVIDFCHLVTPRAVGLPSASRGGEAPAKSWAMC